MSEQIEKLRALEPELRTRGVGSLYLFGSVARGEENADSDIDLFFDDAPNVSLLDVIGIQHFLQDVLGKKVDLTTRDSLHPLLRAEVEAEAIAVF